MFFSYLTVAKKGFLLVSMPLFTGIIFTAILFNLLQQSEKDLADEIAAKETLGVVNQLTVHMVDSTMARAALVIRKSETDPAGADYWLKLSRSDIRRLRSLARGNSKESEKVSQMEGLLESGTKDFGRFINSEEEPTTLSGLVGADQIGLIDTYITRLLDLTESLLAPADRIDREGPLLRSRDRQRIQDLLLAAVCLNVLLSVGMAVYFSKNITERLRKVKDNAVLISKRLPLKPEIEGDDEIASLDRAFHEAASELARLEKIKQDLVAVVSHELKTPLTSVQGIFYLAGQGKFGALTGAAREAVLEAEKQSGQLILIVNDLLDLERLEAANLELTLERISIDSIVRQALAAVSAYADRQGVSIETALSAVHVKVDRTCLTRAVENLLINTLLRSSQGNVVKVTTGLAGNLAEIKVEDQCPGTIKGSTEEIFSRFHHFQPGSKSAAAALARPAESVGMSGDVIPTRVGTGLGLPIARALVELHNGSVGLSETSGHGHIFWIKLPHDPDLEPSDPADII